MNPNLENMDPYSGMTRETMIQGLGQSYNQSLWKVINCPNPGLIDDGASRKRRAKDLATEDDSEGSSCQCPDCSQSLVLRNPFDDLPLQPCKVAKMHANQTCKQVYHQTQQTICARVGEIAKVPLITDSGNTMGYVDNKKLKENFQSFMDHINHNGSATPEEQLGALLGINYVRLTCTTSGTMSETSSVRIMTAAKATNGLPNCMSPINNLGPSNVMNGSPNSTTPYNNLGPSNVMNASSNYTSPINNLGPSNVMNVSSNSTRPYKNFGPGNVMNASPKSTNPFNNLGPSNAMNVSPNSTNPFNNLGPSNAINGSLNSTNPFNNLGPNNVMNASPNSTSPYNNLGPGNVMNASPKYTSPLNNLGPSNVMHASPNSTSPYTNLGTGNVINASPKYTSPLNNLGPSNVMNASPNSTRPYNNLGPGNVMKASPKYTSPFNNLGPSNVMNASPNSTNPFNNSGPSSAMNVSPNSTNPFNNVAPSNAMKVSPNLISPYNNLGPGNVMNGSPNVMSPFNNLGPNNVMNASPNSTNPYNNLGPGNVLNASPNSTSPYNNLGPSNVMNGSPNVMSPYNNLGPGNVLNASPNSTSPYNNLGPSNVMNGSPNVMSPFNNLGPSSVMNASPNSTNPYNNLGPSNVLNASPNSAYLYHNLGPSNVMNGSPNVMSPFNNLGPSNVMNASPNSTNPYNNLGPGNVMNALPKYMNPLNNLGPSNVMNALPNSASPCNNLGPSNAMNALLNLMSPFNNLGPSNVTNAPPNLTSPFNNLGPSIVKSVAPNLKDLVKNIQRRAVAKPSKMRSLLNDRAVFLALTSPLNRACLGPNLEAVSATSSPVIGTIFTVGNESSYRPSPVHNEEATNTTSSPMILLDLKDDTETMPAADCPMIPVSKAETASSTNNPAKKPSFVINARSMSFLISAMKDPVGCANPMNLSLEKFVDSFCLMAVLGSNEPLLIGAVKNPVGCSNPMNLLPDELVDSEISFNSYIRPINIAGKSEPWLIGMLKDPVGCVDPAPAPSPQLEARRTANDNARLAANFLTNEAWIVGILKDPIGCTNLMALTDHATPSNDDQPSENLPACAKDRANHTVKKPNKMAAEASTNNNKIVAPGIADTQKNDTSEKGRASGTCKSRAKSTKGKDSCQRTEGFVRPWVKSSATEHGDGPPIVAPLVTSPRVREDGQATETVAAASTNMCFNEREDGEEGRPARPRSSKLLKALLTNAGSCEVQNRRAHHGSLEVRLLDLSMIASSRYAGSDDDYDDNSQIRTYGQRANGTPGSLLTSCEQENPETCGSPRAHPLYPSVNDLWTNMAACQRGNAKAGEPRTIDSAGAPSVLWINKRSPEYETDEASGSPTKRYVETPIASLTSTSAREQENTPAEESRTSDLAGPPSVPSVNASFLEREIDEAPYGSPINRSVASPIALLTSTSACEQENAPVDESRTSDLAGVPRVLWTNQSSPEHETDEAPYRSPMNPSPIALLASTSACEQENAPADELRTSDLAGVPRILWTNQSSPEHETDEAPYGSPMNASPIALLASTSACEQENVPADESRTSDVAGPPSVPSVTASFLEREIDEAPYGSPMNRSIASPTSTSACEQKNAPADESRTSDLARPRSVLSINASFHESEADEAPYGSPINRSLDPPISSPNSTGACEPENAQVNEPQTRDLAGPLSVRSVETSSPESGTDKAPYGSPIKRSQEPPIASSTSSSAREQDNTPADESRPNDLAGPPSVQSVNASSPENETDEAPHRSPMNRSITTPIASPRSTDAHKRENAPADESRTSDLAAVGPSSILSVTASSPERETNKARGPRTLSLAEPQPAPSIDADSREREHNQVRRSLRSRNREAPAVSSTSTGSHKHSSDRLRRSLRIRRVELLTSSSTSMGTRGRENDCAGPSTVSSFNVNSGQVRRSERIRAMEISNIALASNEIRSDAGTSADNDEEEDIDAFENAAVQDGTNASESDDTSNAKLSESPANVVTRDSDLGRRHRMKYHIEMLLSQVVIMKRRYPSRKVTWNASEGRMKRKMLRQIALESREAPKAEEPTEGTGSDSALADTSAGLSTSRDNESAVPQDTGDAKNGPTKIAEARSADLAVGNSAKYVNVCGICRTAIHNDESSISCESGCRRWFHRFCVNIAAAASGTVEPAHDDWICDDCTQTKTTQN